MAAEDTETASAEPDESPGSATPIEYAKPSTPQVNLASGITRGDVAALAARLSGIYLIISALPTLGFVVFAGFWRGGLDWVVWVYLAYVVIFIGVGTMLIVKAAMIAGWLLSHSTAGLSVAPASGSSQQLQAVAFSVVGVVLAASSLPQLAAVVMRDRGDLLVNMVRPGLELLVGLVLFFRSKRIAQYWEKIPVAPPRGDDAGPL